MKIEVCLTPELIGQHHLAGKIAVVTDIFRATSCIVSGLAHGVALIQPVSTVEETLKMGKTGFIMAGERGGIKVEGFDIGNSPFEYMDDELIGRKVAISTTNGSQAILKSGTADEILIGAFLNLGATVDYLNEQQKDVLVHCAGWKGTPSLEDTLFAGAVVEKLQAEPVNDAAYMAKELYSSKKADLLSAGKASGHAARLSSFGVQKDIAYCLSMDLLPIRVRQEAGGLVSF